MNALSRVAAVIAVVFILCVLGAAGFLAWCVIDAARDRRKARTQAAPAEPDDVDAEIERMTRRYYKQNGGRP